MTPRLSPVPSRIAQLGRSRVTRLGHGDGCGGLPECTPFTVGLQVQVVSGVRRGVRPGPITTVPGTVGSRTHRGRDGRLLPFLPKQGITMSLKTLTSWFSTVRKPPPPRPSPSDASRVETAPSTHKRDTRSLPPVTPPVAPNRPAEDESNETCLCHWISSRPARLEK